MMVPGETADLEFSKRDCKEMSERKGPIRGYFG